MSIREDLESLFEEGEEAQHNSDHEIAIAQEQLATLRTVQERMVAENGVSRNHAQTLKTITTGLESMESHFLQYPVLSYSLRPSKTNLSATQESIGGVVWETLKRIAKSILNAIVKGWNFMASLAKKIYGFFFRTQKAAKSVAATSIIVKDVYSTIFEGVSEDAQERLTAEVMSHELNFRKSLSAKWRELHSELMMRFTSRSGIIALWTEFPKKVIADCILFNTTAKRFTQRIEQDGVTGLVAGSETVANVFNEWNRDASPFRGLAGVTAETAIDASRELADIVSSQASSKKTIDQEPFGNISEVGRMLGELINGPAGTQYNQMLLEVSKNASQFSDLDKAYQKLLASLKEPDDRVNNEALISLKSMMTSIDHGFKACALVNQGFNEMIGFVNENNAALLKIYLKAAKEGGLSDDRKKELEEKLAEIKRV